MWKLALAIALLPQDPVPAEVPVAEQDAVPRLSAPLAWLVDQHDYPLVSRRLVVLEVGAQQPRTLLQPLLRCFDAADRQAARWVGERLLVNGLVQHTRPAPNVSMPLHLVELSAESQSLELTPAAFEATADGRRLLAYSFRGFDVLSLDPLELEPVLSVGEPRLGRSQIRSAHFVPNRDSVLVGVSGIRDGLPSGLWEFPFAGEPERLGASSGRVVEVGSDGSLLSVRRVEPEKYTPHELVRSWPREADRAPEVLACDASWHLSARQAPGTGSERRVAYSRHDRALVLLGAGHPPRVLHQSANGVRDIGWSPDARWLALTDIDTEFKHRVLVVDVTDGEVYSLGAGLRPVFGPPAIQSEGD